MKRKSLQGSYCLMQAALWGAYGFIFSYANRFLLDCGLSSTQAGLVLGIATALSVLIQPLLTQIVDKTSLSCREVLMGSAGLMALCSAALLLPVGMIPTVLIYGAACICLQVLPSFSNAVGMAAMQQGYRLNFGIARGLGSISFGICAQVGNLFISRFGLFTIPLSNLALSILLALSALPFTAEKSAEKEEEKPTGMWEFFLRNKKFFLFLLGATLLFIGHNILTNCMFQIAEYKGNKDAQGTALLISAFVELPTMFLFVRMRRWMNCGKWVCISGMFFTIRLLLSWLLPGVGGLYVAQITQMLGFALYAVSAVYYTAEIIDPADVVKGQTFLGLTNTTGCFIAHFLGGALIDFLGVGKMFLICVIISAAGTLLFFLSVERKAKKA